jgi:putative ABC transport system permease protein
VTARPVEARQSGAVIPASVVSAAGFATVERNLHATHMPWDRAALERELSAVSGLVYISVVEDFDRMIALLLSAVLGGALVLVLGGTFAATGLAAADMRGDLDTMSAIGAPPRGRRLVVAGQAGFIAGLGALVGVVAGGVLGVALAWQRTGNRGPGPLPNSFSIPGEAVVSIPWGFAAALLLGLPLLAALLAGSLTRTRLTLARRPA